MAATPTDAGHGMLTPAFGTVTMTIATPCVVTFTAHGLNAGDKVQFQTTGALPTGITAGTTYFVIATGLVANSFEISATAGGSAANTSGTQSGTHTLISEQFVWSSSSAGVWKFRFNPTTMAAGDIVEQRVYDTVLSAGTESVYLMNREIGAQPIDDVVAAAIPFDTAIATANTMQCSLKQTAGTARALAWSVIAY